ncbi:MAG: hypothetical protein LBM73_03825, partial [Candidatus Nomurabacteria bacterium]|nr:hypothetical protein [Candidatus Nomurabacteria bacterium]
RAENFQPRGQLNADSRENWGAGHPTNSFVAELPDRSTRVIFNLSGKVLTDEKTKISDSAQSENDSIPAKLFFNDQRKFGWIRLLKTADVAQMEFVKKLGPEPLDENPPLEQFLKNIRRHQNSAVKAAILDQSVVAGIGNIYADESLWAARVHPAARVKNLSDRKLEKILLSAIAVMKKSIASGGSTMRNYIRADGSKGDYLEKFAKVFRRDGRPCPRCGRVIQKIRVAGRGTHICPNCQKMPGEKSK